MYKREEIKCTAGYVQKRSNKLSSRGCTKNEFIVKLDLEIMSPPPPPPHLFIIVIHIYMFTRHPICRR